MKREIKFKLLYKAKRARKWIISQSFEIKELQEGGFQFDFNDGTYLMSNEIPPFNDKDEYGETKLIQYTTLKDKNEKEIYEGDIIKHSYRSQLTVIEWQPLKAQWSMGGYQTESTEVIGNIYENPELLRTNREK